MGRYSSVLIFLSVIGLCATGAMGNPKGDIETRGIELASQYVREIVGAEFFEESVQRTGVYIGAEGSDEVQVTYLFVVETAPEDYPTFVVRVDVGKGSAFSLRRIPGCKDSADNCEVRVSRDQAIVIAEENGLEAGIAEWKVELQTIQNSDHLLWAIENTTTQETGPCGKVVLVSAYSGEVVETLKKSISR